MGTADDLLELLRARRPWTVLTGAGISTDSGIPDYRGRSGDRRRTPSITYREFMRQPAARRRYWARSHVGYARIGRAEPNAGHLALTDLQRAGLVGRVVTQNVDGLHQRAGTVDVLDLHGRLDTVVCTSCGLRRSREEMAADLDARNPGFDPTAGVVLPDGDVELPPEAADGFRVPPCPRCGGVLKPHVVFFGESLPPGRKEEAAAAVRAGEGLLVAGSSLAVMSGYRLVLQADAEDRPVGIVTRGVTRGDHLAAVRVDDGLSETLTAVAAAIGSGPRPTHV